MEDIDIEYGQFYDLDPSNSINISVYSKQCIINIKTSKKSEKSEKSEKTEKSEKSEKNINEPRHIDYQTFNPAPQKKKSTHVSKKYYIFYYRNAKSLDKTSDSDYSEDNGEYGSSLSSESAFSDIEQQKQRLITKHVSLSKIIRQIYIFMVIIIAISVLVIIYIII